MLQGCLSPVLPVFLSTPSARRATLLLNLTMSSCRNFYPRPPRGGRPFTPPCRCVHQNFYPRPPRGGRPPLPRLRVAVIKNFYPRPPRGGRPSAATATGLGRRNFYPRPPRGGRQYRGTLIKSTRAFLSTPSARRATRLRVMSRRGTWLFLSTPSARRATGKHRPHNRSAEHFYPRPPRGGRQHGSVFHDDHEPISIHALREEGDGTSTITN